MRIKPLRAATALLVFTAASFAQNPPSLGESPEVVRKTQEALAAQGYDPGPSDGQWNSKTEQALKQAQQDREFEPSGQIDQRTLASLGVSDADNPFMRETQARASPAPSPAEPSSR
jgi:hypothetical protein